MEWNKHIKLSERKPGNKASVDKRTKDTSKNTKSPVPGGAIVKFLASFVNKNSKEI